MVGANNKRLGITTIQCSCLLRSNHKLMTEFGFDYVPIKITEDTVWATVSQSLF